jgi:hypothetical protein
VIVVEKFYLLLRVFLLDLDVFVMPFLMFFREALICFSHADENEGLVSINIVISGKRIHRS